MSENPISWVDITANLKSNVKNMKLGQMVHSPEFSLYDVMSAVEVLDGKMDPNFGVPRVPCLQELLEAQKIPLELSKTQVLAVMDQLLCAMFSWFEGYTLPQSLQTCYYLHDLSLIQDKHLSLFCKVLVKISQEIIALTTQMEMKDDEEFFPVQFELKLPIVTDNLSSLLDKAEEELKQQTDLLCRVRFIKLFFLIHTNFVKKNPSPNEKHLKLILSELEMIGKTHPEEIAPGFDSNYFRRVSTVTPLKEKQILTFEKTLISFTKFFKDMSFVTPLTSWTSVDLLLANFYDFSQLGPIVVLRNYVTNTFFSQNKLFGTIEITHMTKCHLLDIPSIRTAQITMLTDDSTVDMPQYLNNYGRVFILIFYALCSNKGRSRRRIANIFAELQPIQGKSMQFDVNGLKIPEEKKFSLTLSTIELTCWAMKTYIELGFETDLYQTIEYPYLYFYMEHVLGTRLKKMSMLNEPLDPKKKKKRIVPIIREMLVQIEYLMARGVARYVLAFRGMSEFKYPFDLGSEEIRYMNRFAPFTAVQQPPYITYKYFTEQKMTVDENLQAATESFERAKIFIEKVLENEKMHDKLVEKLKGFLKICSGNLISLKLTTTLYKMKTLNTNFDFSHSKVYPVIKPAMNK